MSAIIETRSGRIAGHDGAVRVFKGIPYAAPPVGDLRWRPPQPVAPWSEIRETLNFGFDCPQIPLPEEPSAGPGKNEDCLTINIWTAARGMDERLPVMVYIHGGGFVAGSGADIRCEGTELAKKGVVVVTFNYRLGIFGFLAHPALNTESGTASSGNYGLMDQICALHWVRDNIAAFGGDPSRVTLFGVSAGSASIVQLMACESAHGLFSGVILESAGAFRPLCPLDEAEAQGALLGNDLAALRALSAEAIFARTKEIVPQVRALTKPRALRPILDGHLIRENDRDAFKAGRVAKVPTIVGSNWDEGTIFVGTWPVETIAKYRTLVEQNFGAMTEEALALYPAPRDEDARAATATLFADTQFNFGTRGIAQEMTRHQPKTYRYLFTKRGRFTRRPPDHGLEVSYVFGNLDAWPDKMPMPYDKGDRAMSDTMMDTWVTFAATGDPNGADTPVWAPYNAVRDNYLEFGDMVRAGTGWRTIYLDFLERYFDTP
jgi:para-nitrobenzyl esterase